MFQNLQISSVTNPILFSFSFLFTPIRTLSLLLYIDLHIPKMYLHGCYMICVSNNIVHFHTYEFWSDFTHQYVWILCCTYISICILTIWNSKLKIYIWYMEAFSSLLHIKQRTMWKKHFKKETVVCNNQRFTCNFAKFNTGW